MRPSSQQPNRFWRYTPAAHPWSIGRNTEVIR